MYASPSIIQSYYINENKHDPLSHHGRFLSPEFHWMAWAYSCLQLIKLYGDVTIYTNSLGAEILIEKLKLPYTKVNLSLDAHDIDPGLPFLSKIHTYSLQERPFIHIDGDVILWEKFQENLISSPLITQNSETADGFYRKIYQKLNELNTWLPQCIWDKINSDSPLRVFNVGIIGGQNFNFFKELSKMALEMIENNKKILSSLKYTDFNLIYEQHLFYCLSEYQKIKVNTYKTEDVKDLDFQGYANFTEAPHINKFVHLLGNFKKDEDYCLKLARRLRDEYPENYYHIIDTCKKAHVKMFLSCYSDDVNELVYPDKRISSSWKDLYLDEQNNFNTLNKALIEAGSLSDLAFVLNPNLVPGDAALINFPENTSLTTYCALTLTDNVLSLDALDSWLVDTLMTKTAYTDIVRMVFDEMATGEDPAEFEMIEMLISKRLIMGVEENLFAVEKSKIS